MTLFWGCASLRAGVVAGTRPGIMPPASPRPARAARAHPPRCVPTPPRRSRRPSLPARIRAARSSHEPAHGGAASPRARGHDEVRDGDLQYAFFTNSGTESVEGCLKAAMLATGRSRFVGMLG